MAEWDTYGVLAEKVVAGLWNTPLLPHVDDTARIACRDQLQMILACRDIKGSSIDELVAETSRRLRGDRLFRSDIEHMNEKGKSDFQNFYATYGGPSALMAACLLADETGTDDTTERAKRALLNWYVENRNHAYTFLHGGSVCAWFPYEWFIENFSNIAASIVAGVITIAGRALAPPCANKSETRT